jgi:hypothetical protein
MHIDGACNYALPTYYMFISADDVVFGRARYNFALSAQKAAKKASFK